MTKTFITRVLSALAAVFVIGALYYFFEITGLKMVCYIAVLLCGLEFMEILFPPATSKVHKALFYLFLLLIFHGAAHYPSLAGIGFSILCILFVVVTLFTHAHFEDLGSLVNYQAKGLLGFVYLGLFPSYALRILDLNNGLIWFLALLGIVFAGDIGAYLVGIFFGKHKVNPRLSPKKSWEGSVGGAFGSLLTGYGCSFFLPDTHLPSLLVTSVVVGLIAQSGDFFESLLKRVADVKDSGSLMPGHGGLLDRIDGVLFASPVLLLAASLFEAGFQL
jgi:phosphatidate cytidylyltransferase